MDTLCARATLFFALDDLPACERDLLRALEISPGHAQALINLGVLRERQNRVEAALEAYGRALSADPQSFAARLNRAGVNLRLGRAEDALQDLDVLVTHRAGTAAVHVGRARALFALHRDAEALGAAEAALGLEPSNVQAAMDRGIALASLGRLEEARRVLAPLRTPEHGSRLDPLAIRISRLILRMAVCDWTERDAACALVRSAGADGAVAEALDEPGHGFYALGLPLSPAELATLGDVTMRSVRRRGAKLAPGLPSPTGDPSRRRLRVGFFAASLRVHPESYLLRRLFLERDPARFEYFLYALNADDGSALRSEIAQSADRYVDVSSWDSASIVRLARSDLLDLAIDLSGGYEHARPEIFAARVAPVQAGYIATPTTLGPALHDYRLSDRWTTPPQAQPHWWEKLVLLDVPPWVYDDSLAPGPAGDRANHGLPAERFVFTCMNQAFKLDPESFSVWMRLLCALPGSVLWLLDAGPVARANLRREASARGVNPERLVFAPRVPLAEHLGRLAHADLFLDTFHCNAHTTALDALWAGVPVLTLEGSTMASRLGSAFVRAAGLPELAVTSAEAYEAAALRFAREPEALGAIKARLRTKPATLPAFDTMARVRSVERAFVAMVERHRAGLAPDTLFVE